MLDFLHDPGFGKPSFARAHFCAHLRGDDDFIAAAVLLEPFADDRFRFAAGMAGNPYGINVGGIDCREACIEKPIQKSERSGFISRPAENIAAENKRRNLYAGTAKLALLHAPLL